ncbi:peptide chain release factor 1 [Salibacterium salarium]|uniref:Peptide chain release factor 1 n=1 Tax=Salibacterium salarium TaxID=284579 RepID=A0A428MS57_9BACI|nr:peptide chain release factor 1 [Salibacterium salarium]RSL28930.1 peptide chain release factor 1 [Salibacterium salarium]
MLERLQAVEDRYEQLNEWLSDPDVVNDTRKLREYSKEQADISEIVEKYREYRDTTQQLEDAKAMLQDNLDDEMQDMVKMEMEELSSKQEELEETLRVLLLPKDPNDDKNVIVEVRGAAGGDEASLFAGDLYKMYSRFAEKNNWKAEVIESTPTELGGFSKIIFMINGEGAYSKMKYENGAHRVQRVPSTESGGRIHTSTATVAVLPEAEEVEVDLHDKDIRVDTFAASGPGGQSVNTTMSAVRLTHEPTGVVVSCQDEKSQLKNKDKAMKVLRARIYDMYKQEAEQEYADNRKSAVGTGDRSERIRTYNFPQSRVTDHRIGLTVQKLDQILQGELEQIIEALIVEEQAEMMEQAGEA